MQESANQTAKQRATAQLLSAAGIMPVVTVDDIPQAMQIATALLRGGLTAIEVTLRSSAAMQAIGVIKKELPQLCVGAGTVLTIEQAHQARDQGADFLVTPGTTPALGAGLAAMSLPVVPGAATPSEIIALMALGFDAVKLFPAASVGGVGMAKSLGGPFPQLKLCPTGGISEVNAIDFLKLANVLCIGGSWMVAPEWIAKGQYDLVESSAKRCCDIIKSA
jgi:2-dehydro-3-deoxyphosphogluconate aldolase / (4S)-4-hydroxy-2-oxoglutarate aldolase